MDKSDKRFPFFRSIEVHITEECNLNCKGCFHFIPLAKPKYYTLEEVRDNLEKLRAITKNRPMAVHILGGEPLLHPQVLDFCKMAKEIFPEGRMFLITNGILLKQQSQEFFDTLNQLEFTVMWSEYFEDPELEQLVKTKFEHHWIYKHPEMCSHFIDLHHPAELNDAYDYCTNYAMAQIKDGYAYKCCFPAWISHLTQYFNYKLPEDYNDELNRVSLDTGTLEELDNLILQPCDFCKYCKLSQPGVPQHAPWSLSNKIIEEWLVEDETYQ